MNRLAGYKTIIVNGAIFVVMLASALTGQIDDPSILRGIVLIQSVANVVLRFLTTGPAIGRPSQQEKP